VVTYSFPELISGLGILSGCASVLLRSISRHIEREKGKDLQNIVVETDDLGFTEDEIEVFQCFGHPK